MTVDISGSGLGTPSLPPTQTYEQQVTSAKSEYDHMVMNTLSEMKSENTSITDWNPIERHRSEPGRPTLPPLSQTRVSVGLGEVTEAPREDIMQSILAFLPPDVLSRLLFWRKQPQEQRDPAYVALDKSLGALAKGMEGLAGTATAAMSADAVHLREIIAATPYRALLSLSDYNTAVLDGVYAYLEEVGPNDPYHDALLGMYNEAKDLSGGLQAYTDAIAKGDLEGVRGDKIAEFAARAIDLRDRYNGLDIGPNGQMMGTALEVNVQVTSALAMPLGSPTLNMATVTAAGTLDVGDDLQSVTRGVSESFGQLNWNNDEETSRLTNLSDGLKEIREGAG